MYDKAIKIDPKSSIAYNNKGYKFIWLSLGLSLDNLQLYSEAIKMYD